MCLLLTYDRVRLVPVLSMLCVTRGDVPAHYLLV